MQIEPAAPTAWRKEAIVSYRTAGVGGGAGGERSVASLGSSCPHASCPHALSRYSMITPALCSALRILYPVTPWPLAVSSRLCLLGDLRRAVARVDVDRRRRGKHLLHHPAVLEGPILLGLGLGLGVRVRG